MAIPYSSFSPKLSKSDISLTNWTKSFKNSSQKIVKAGIFGPKFKEFYFRIKFKEHYFRNLVPSLKIIFSKKFCNKTNSRVLISNMTILFLNSSPSKSKLSKFASGKFKEFFAGNFAARQVQGHGSQT